MITIQISGNDISELKKNIAVLTEMMEPKQEIHIKLPDADVPPVKAEPKAKAKKAAAKEELPPVKEEPQVVEATKEQAQKALQELNVKKGIVVARAILKEFECARLSEVKPEQYAAFVKACEAASV